MSSLKAIGTFRRLKAEHVHAAIKEVAANGFPHRRASCEYDLVVGRHAYPQKYITCIAARYATGDELLPSEFSARESKAWLEHLGFTIMSKNGHEHEKKSITGPIIGDLYYFSQQVYQKKLAPKEALLCLDINAASARDCFRNFKQMMAGRVYQRTMNYETTDYFLSHIFQDFGPDGLGAALEALNLHLNYYDTLGHGSQRKIRELWKKYMAVVSSSNKHGIVGTYGGRSPSFRGKPTSTAIDLSLTNTQLDAPLSTRDKKFLSDTWKAYGTSDFERLDMDAGNIRRALERGFLTYVSGDVGSPQCRFRLTASARLTHEDKDSLFLNEAGSQTTHTEGEATEVMRKLFKRSPSARADCLKHHGYKCQVCKFDFETSYGAIGRDFIHVHHRVEISSIGKNYKIDPVHDLVPVCANCHAMLHQKRPAIAVEELAKIVKKNMENT